MYQALGGIYVPWTQEMTDTWLSYASMNADLLTEPFDVVVLHDPQPAAIRSFAPEYVTKWLYHSHLDLSSAQDDVWMQLRHHIQQFDAAIFEAEHFTRDDVGIQTYIVPPAIDPNSPRNMPLPDDVVRTVLERYGIDPERPLVVQVSPCDTASDLMGAAEACCSLYDKHPGLQLAIILTTEPHDPQGRQCYDDLARRCAEDHQIFVLNMGNEVGNVEVNVFQRAADVVIQKGLRKGFGMWMSDALWKQRPCVVAPVGGLQEQVVDGETGIVAATNEEFAAAIDLLLKNRELARRYGENGRRHVAQRFLITRYLRDYLHVLTDLHRRS
jgi:trehalose synthase